MPKSYTKKRKGERTSIAIDPRLTNRIDKLLKNKETLAEFSREAINQKLWDRESEKLAALTDSEQFHKIENMKKDIEELKKDHVTAKELVNLELETVRIEKHVNMIQTKLLGAVNTNLETYREAIALLKTAKKNPIIRKELEKY